MKPGYLKFYLFYGLLFSLASISIDLSAQGGRALADGPSLDGLTFLQSGRNNSPGGQPLSESGASQIDGTPYLFEDFQPGVLHFNTGKIAYAPITYDIFNQRITVQLQDGNYNVSYQVLDGFDLVAPDGDTLAFQKVTTLPRGITTGLGEEVFVEVLYQGHLTLVGNHRKNFLDEPTSSTTYNNGRENPEYNDQPMHYYLLQPGQPAEQVKLRTSWLRRYFDLSRKEVKQAIDEAGAAPASDAAAIAIVRYVDQR